MGDYINMADRTKSSEEQLKGENDSENRARPLVSLPNIILTRIDPAIITSFTAVNTKQKVKFKNVTFKNKNVPLKTVIKSTLSKTEGKPRGRPKKINSFSPKSPQKPFKKSIKNGQQINTKAIKNEKAIKKLIKNELQTIKRVKKNDQQSEKKSTKNVLQNVKKAVKKSVNQSRTIAKPQISATKALLKKTMLQKKNKISIPQLKKPKSNKKSVSKQTPLKTNKPIAPAVKTNPKPKPIPSAIKINPQPPVSTDSSEDEFLYDELIDEFENTFNKSPQLIQSVSEKTTNITLKPSTGNKPPTIVKGGIIKIQNLPADLKTIASPGQQLYRNSEPTSRKRSKPTKCPTPSKNPSPWPISILNSPKTNINSHRIEDKVNKNSPALKINSVNSSAKSKVSVKPHQNQSNDSGIHGLVKDRPPTLMPGRPKIGPKQMAKVVPMSKTLNEDDNLSEDEYTEEETLENLDYLTDETPNQESFKQNTVNEISAFDSVSSAKLTITPVETVKDDEDPNIDLLRILTDDSEDCMLNQPDKHQDKENNLSYNNDNTKNQTVNDSKPNKEFANKEVTEEPKERTIYDLMNEVSLQRPSWNLHIIPETHAFCIAQVTKGRLGLPTLKKCIELDPVDYNTKVYIHQYHIKRFDGVYDSEESILALIEEIDSIKA